MADDKNKQDFRDRNKIAANEDYEVDYVAKGMALTARQSLMPSMQ